MLKNIPVSSITRLEITTLSYFKYRSPQYAGLKSFELSANLVTAANPHRNPTLDLQRQTRVQIVLQITVIGAFHLHFFYPKDTPSNTTLEV